jgi:hypothetical protein
LLAGRIKVDEVGAGYIGEHAAAVYYTGGRSRKGDTIYLRSTFDVDDLDQQGTVVHELSHAADDKAASGVTSAPADRMELKAFRAQARFYLSAIQALAGDKRSKAIERVAEHTGKVRILTMMMEANVAPASDTDELIEIIAAINVASGALGARMWQWTVTVSNAALESEALKAIRRLERLKPGDTGQNDGLSGESILDWKFR